MDAEKVTSLPTPFPPAMQPAPDSYVKIYDPGVGESESWYINDHCFV